MIIKTIEVFMDKDQNFNVKIENKEVAQFTGMARAQMFFETVMSFLRMLLSVVVVGAILSGVGYFAWAIYQDNTKPKAPPAKTSQSKPIANQQQQSSDLSSWRQLKKNMSEEQVRALLGEPAKVDGGTFAFWHYRSGGTVTFYNDRVDSWTEPR
jgi:outer membrane protein assembly factor BamE (lipoprotein component of BamABCDE complex)